MLFAVEHLTASWHRTFLRSQKTLEKSGRVERISLDGFFAEIICDVQAVPPIWHCIVQYEGSGEVLFWSQEESWSTALHAADGALADLSRGTGDHDRVANDATIRDKKFMTLHETTQRLRSRR